MGKPASGDGSVNKALGIMDLIALQDKPVRFTDILKQCDLPKATLYRVMQTLTREGMLAFDRETSTYALGLRLVKLAHNAWRQSSLAPIARPFVDQLASQVSETVHLAQMQNGQVLYVDKRNAAEPIEMFSQAGKVGPGYCTGIGKAILAFMEPESMEKAINQQSFYRYTDRTITRVSDLRKELAAIKVPGVSFDREEHEPGIICIAAPILSGKEKVVGGISITSTLARYSLDEIKQFKPALLATAKQIGEAARNWQFPEQT